ncbi:MAG: uracil-DNA glycosylase family protein [Ktedonobacterales bacterium]
MSEEHPIEHLFMLLDQVVAPYPAGVVPLWARIGGTAFFPGGAGLWGTVPHQPLPPMPIGGVMVLGHNFDCETGFAASLHRDGENLNGPTWRTICSVLRQAGIALEQCFFTNAYMGLKAGSEPIGTFPGARDGDFVRRCQRFLTEQIRLQQPRLLLTLGKEVPPVLAPLAPELRLAWMGLRTLQEVDARGVALVDSAGFPGVQQVTAVVALTHPANRAPNVRRRRYNGLEGDAAEQALLQDALMRVGPLGCGAARS